MKSALNKSWLTNNIIITSHAASMLKICVSFLKIVKLFIFSNWYNLWCSVQCGCILRTFFDWKKVYDMKSHELLIKSFNVFYDSSVWDSGLNYEMFVLETWAQLAAVLFENVLWLCSFFMIIQFSMLTDVS